MMHGARLPLAAPLALLVLLASSSGCQDYRFEQVCSVQIKEADVNIVAAEPTPADILFVVDNSGSMADEQENLARNFQFFINEIAGAGDYRIAVVTTDQVTGSGDRQGLQTFTYCDEFPYSLKNFSADGCTEAGIPLGCFRGPDPATRIIDSTMDRDTQISTFQQNVRVGSCGSGNETGIKAMLSALRQAEGGCNQGFLRDNANLIIILVSDEEDADQTPIEDYVRQLEGFKSYSQVRVAAIVGSSDGEASACSVNEGDACGSICRRMDEIPTGSGAPCDPRGSPNQCDQGEFCSGDGNVCRNEKLRHWSSVNCGWCSFFNAPDCCSALAGSRYVSFARAIEGRVSAADPTIPVSACRAMPGTKAACLIDSICQADFGQTLARIARELVITNQYTLNPPAFYPPGVKITIQGGRFPDGVVLGYETDFTISMDGRVLTILGEKSPKEGEDVQISYVTERDDGPREQRGACGPMM